MSRTASEPLRSGSEARDPAPLDPAPLDHSPLVLHWDELPIALAEGQRLRAVTAAAGRAGIRAGMNVAEARARCAALDVLPWDEMAVRDEIVRATAALLIASPQVTPVAGAPGTWWIGAGGLDALGGERALVRTLLRIARVWHPHARVAVADSCVAARAGTWHLRMGDPPDAAAATRATRERIRGTASRLPASAARVPASPDRAALIVPRRGCAAYLATAPLGLIPMREEIRQALLALGLRTAGAFAALEGAETERRWGNAGLVAWRLARGEDRRRPVLTRLEAKRAATAELAMPTATMEPVLFLVRAALDRLVRELVADARAAATVAITLALDDARGAFSMPPSADALDEALDDAPGRSLAHTITREIRMARPLARVAPLFERCRALLDQWTLTAPVSGVTVAITATAPTAAEQGELLDPAWRDPAAIEAALARLRAELGPNVVVRPIACDDHRPERAGAWIEAESESPTTAIGSTSASARADTSMASDPTIALRLLEAPEEIEVECVSAMPSVLGWRGRRIVVDRASGPERLSGDWWKDAYARDYWRCEEEGGRGEMVIFRDRSRAGADRWYVHGWYD